jgi:hypothetical protein
VIVRPRGDALAKGAEIMARRNRNVGALISVQVVAVTAFAAAYASMPRDLRHSLNEELTGATYFPAVEVPRREALAIEPLYDDPELVSDEELAAVLNQVAPRFDRRQLVPNFVEHALRAWGTTATFQDPRLLSGDELKAVLLDHSVFGRSWEDQAQPLLEERPRGIAIRWGSEPGASLHHDHLLASLTEAGVTLDEPVFAPGRRDMTVEAILQEALRDFELDDQEVEWSAMAFALWLPPVTSWRTLDGRRMDFDLIAQRLVRGHKQLGVCAGTHRVYSLMLLWRLDRELHDEILSDAAAGEVYRYLQHVRDLLIDCQFEDGRWPSNWSAGRQAVENPIPDDVHRQVVSTGHHLEWLAIAPEDLHPPRERIRRAADWIIQQTVSEPSEQIQANYTFYSHVGNALALWRKTRPAEFWHAWEQQHPFRPEGTSGEVFVPPAPAPLPPLPAPLAN